MPSPVSHGKTRRVGRSLPRSSCTPQFVYSIVDPGRFASSRQGGAYLGLVSSLEDGWPVDDPEAS